MSNWFNHTHTSSTPVDTTGVTAAFMAMDAELSRVQDLVNTYRLYCPNRLLDPVWNQVLNNVEVATDEYMALISPEAMPNTLSVDHATALLEATQHEIDTFSWRYSTALSQALDEKARQAAEAEKVRQEAAQRQQEAAERAARLPGEAAKALSSISTRIQAARNRMVCVGPAMSRLLREFADGSDDLTGCQERAQEFLRQAVNALAVARTAQQTDPAHALELARTIRILLSEADELIDAAPERLRTLLELKADPGQYAAKVRFKLKDAQRYAVDHGKAAEEGSVLDFQLKRITDLEASLMCTYPKYWAYRNGLDEVTDSIQAALRRMRA